MSCFTAFAVAVSELSPPRVIVSERGKLKVAGPDVAVLEEGNSLAATGQVNAELSWAPQKCIWGKALCRGLKLKKDLYWRQKEDDPGLSNTADLLQIPTHPVSLYVIFSQPPFYCEQSTTRVKGYTINCSSVTNEKGARFV